MSATANSNAFEEYCRRHFDGEPVGRVGVYQLRLAFYAGAVSARAEELRNMDSAPKDGTPFLAWLPTYYQGKGAWAIVLMLHGDWMDNRAWKVEPTGWMPLPPGPLMP